MKTYLFYTSEGVTQSPANIDVENLQVLGFSNGETYKNALDVFLQQNKWITEYGYDVFKIKCVQLLTDSNVS